MSITERIGNFREGMSLNFLRRSRRDKHLRSMMDKEITTKLIRRKVRYVERTSEVKPKIIQIDCLGNQYACPEKDKIIAKTIEDCEKKSSYYFNIWPFKCEVTINGNWVPRIGFTCTYVLGGKKYDICSDLLNAATEHYLKLKPHSDIRLQYIDERFFLIEELSSKQKVIESLPFKGVYVTYSPDCDCLTMQSAQHMSATTVKSLFRMYPKNDEDCPHDEADH